MRILRGDDAISYAERTGRTLFRAPEGEEDRGEAITFDAARALTGDAREEVFLTLAYSGYVVDGEGRFLIQRIAENPWGFELCDGEEAWPGGCGYDGELRPVKAAQVPADRRRALDRLRDLGRAAGAPRHPALKSLEEQLRDAQEGEGGAEKE